MNEVIGIAAVIVVVIQLILIWLHFSYLGRITRAIEQMVRTSEVEATTRFEAMQDTKKIKKLVEGAVKAAADGS
jgi:cell division protein FtsX